MASRPFIAVVGSANVDLTTFHDAFPKPGETIFGKSFDLGFGGKGANQAVAARLCGANVAMVAKVGNDLFGPATIKNFEAQGIDASCVGIAEGVSSGVAPIFVDPKGQNRIIVVKGANDLLAPEDVDAAEALLRKANAIVLQFEIPLRTVYHAVEFAKRTGIPCIVNPARALLSLAALPCFWERVTRKRKRFGERASTRPFPPQRWARKNRSGTGRSSRKNGKNAAHVCKPAFA